MPNLNEKRISWEDEFDKEFGKAGAEMNCDSIGKRAGCDDCSENILEREKHKEFVKKSLAERDEEILKMIEGKRGSGDCPHCESENYDRAISDISNLIKSKENI